MATADRPYQISSIDGLRQGFRDGHIRQVLSSPTGSGKSVIMLDMIKKAVAKGSRVGFICERRILVEQFSKHLDAEGIDHGILMAKHWRFKPEKQVQVATAQTLEKMDALPFFDVCFIDEIHAAMRLSVKRMMENFPKIKVIGATATPFHPELGKYFSSITSVISMRDLVDQTYLVPFKVFVAREIDTSGLKIVAGEWKKDDLEKRGQQIVGDVVSDYQRISQDVFGRPSKAICFSCGIAHGADLAVKFNEAGINAVQISANDEDEFRAEVLADFAKPDSEIKVLISVSILSRGFDQTDVEHVILARPLKKSFSEHVQMIGRGARSHPGKKHCVVQDNSGNWTRFQSLWDEFYENGANSLNDGQDAKPKPEPTDKEKEAAKCPKCGHLWNSSSDFCAHCGFERVRMNQVIALPGEMVEIDATSRVKKKPEFTSQYKEEWYHGMIGLLRQGGKNENRAYHLYTKKFGVAPAWKKIAGTPSLDVSNYLRASNIAFAKARKA